MQPRRNSNAVEVGCVMVGGGASNCRRQALDELGWAVASGITEAVIPDMRAPKFSPIPYDPQAAYTGWLSRRTAVYSSCPSSELEKGS
jgi:hypothetical protein